MQINIDENLEQLFYENVSAFNLLILLKFKKLAKTNVVKNGDEINLTASQYRTALKTLSKKGYISKNSTNKGTFFEILSNSKSKKKESENSFKMRPKDYNSIVDFLKNGFAVESTKTKFCFNIRGNLEKMAEEFYNYYQERNWKDVKCWKNRMRTWYNKDFSKLKGTKKVDSFYEQLKQEEGLNA